MLHDSLEIVTRWHANRQIAKPSEQESFTTLFEIEKALISMAYSGLYDGSGKAIVDSMYALCCDTFKFNVSIPPSDWGT